MPTKTLKVKKIEPKTVTPKKQFAPKKTSQQENRTTGLTVKVFDTNGKPAGTVVLPKEIFGVTPNEKLLEQALHVYFTNSQTHAGHTKTRAEVRGGGRKPWRQKGTGNARAGSNRSPLWVGGGVTFGPRSRQTKLELPKKMRKQALISALSQKAKNGDIKIISNFEKIQPKTKAMASLLSKLEAKIPVVLVSSESKNIQMASRNIQKTSVQKPENLNAYELIRTKELIISKEALEKFKI